jgi:solute carrier family 50 protein (sugar transporter)
MWDRLISACSALGLLSSLALFFSPLSTVRHFRKLNSTASTPIFPYVAMYVNCACWAKYGLMTRNWSILGTNLTGLALSLYYVYCFDKFNTSPSLSRGQFIFALVFLYGLLAVLHYLPFARAVEVLGLVSGLCSVLMFGAPLVTVWYVFRAEDSSSMSFRLSAMNLICSTCWTLYGFLLKDKFIMAPNLLAIILSLVQLFIIHKYPAKESRIDDFEAAKA